MSCGRLHARGRAGFVDYRRGGAPAGAGVEAPTASSVRRRTGTGPERRRVAPTESESETFSAAGSTRFKRGCERNKKPCPVPPPAAAGSGRASLQRGSNPAAFPAKRYSRSGQDTQLGAGLAALANSIELKAICHTHPFEAQHLDVAIANGKDVDGEGVRPSDAISSNGFPQSSPKQSPSLPPAEESNTALNTSITGQNTLSVAN